MTAKKMWLQHYKFSQHQLW